MCADPKNEQVSTITVATASVAAEYGSFNIRNYGPYLHYITLLHYEIFNVA